MVSRMLQTLAIMAIQRSQLGEVEEGIAAEPGKRVVAEIEESKAFQVKEGVGWQRAQQVGGQSAGCKARVCTMRTNPHAIYRPFRQVLLGRMYGSFAKEMFLNFRVEQIGLFSAVCMQVCILGGREFS